MLSETPSDGLNHFKLTPNRIVILLILWLFQSGHTAAAIDCSNLVTWDAALAYVKDSQVKKNNSAYQSRWWNQNRDPAIYSGPYDEWQPLGLCDASDPAPTPTPPPNQSGDCSDLPPWSATGVYTSGQQVQHRNSKYKANWWTQGQDPEIHSGTYGPWTLLSQCGPDSSVQAVQPSCNNLNIDNDVDGIPDCAEESGKTFYGMPLHEWGARKDKTDLFIEIDYMQVVDGDHGMQPTRKVLERVVETFAAQGFAVHFDIGDLFDQNPGTDPADFDLGGGQAIPYEDTSDIQTLKSNYIPLYFANNPFRKRIFYYGVFGHRQPGTGSSGRAPDFFDYFFLVTVGNWGLNDSNTTNTNILTNFQAGTLLHEWGHVLGLAHGGSPDSNSGNNKPNHLSSMNYMYQLTGVPKDYADISRYELILDRYQIYQGDNYACYDRLRERRPQNNTWTGLLRSAAEDPSLFNIDFAHGAEGDLDEVTLIESATLGGMDYSCDGVVSSGVLPFDLDNTLTYDVLGDFDDWNNLYLYYRYLNYQDGVFQNIPVNLSQVISPAGIPVAAGIQKDAIAVPSDLIDIGVVEQELPSEFFNQLRNATQQ